MNNPDLRQKIFNYIAGQKLAVVATVHSNGKPEAAVIQFAVTEELQIVFNTFSSYRKYKNLKTNSAVALVFGGEDKITIQYEGKVIELIDPELEQYKLIFLIKNPKAKKWDTFPETRWFLVHPTWIRYADLRHDHTNKIELNFD